MTLSYNSMKRFVYSLITSICMMCAMLRGATAEGGAGRLDLAGEWRVTLSGPQLVQPQGALPELAFDDALALPGTLELRGKGPINEAAEAGGLTRVRKFEGAAWFQRDVEIPAAFAGKRVVLSLERTRFTQVWLDGKPCGERALYGSSQTYDLTGVATPGRHQLTVLVDNRTERVPTPNPHAHQYSDDTHTNWNGLLGKLTLVATDLVWLDDVQVHSDLEKRVFRVVAIVGNATGQAAGGALRVSAQSWNHPGQPHQPPVVERPFVATGTDQTVELELPLGDGARTWDEFNPALYQVTVSIFGDAGQDRREVTAGLREFKTRDGHFTINGRTTFLRGKHEAGAFPLTGFPPMDVEGWLAYFRICQEYGINHIRCHTWIPPKAAFEAADQLGIYLQPELPFWGTFSPEVRTALWPEAEAMLREYGNHPSFVMLTLANEAGGDRTAMNAMVSDLRSLDGRRLYADGCNNVLWEPRLQPTNDFWVSAKIIPPGSDKAVVARGSYCVFDGDEGPTQWGPATTRNDLSAATTGVPVPVMGHETAQWTMYPDFSEIAKYTGVTRARNLERFRDIAARKGVLEQNRDFARASGALAAALYREENELFLRTPRMGGFQLLDLQDYPGQGSALVGVLDAFMDSKGHITPAQWRESCSPVVPLARFDRYTWTVDETYVADLELAHYGEHDLKAATAEWTLSDVVGAVRACGALPAQDLAQGGLREVGRIAVPLAKLPAPARYTLAISVRSGAEAFTNHYPLWVYPAKIDTTVPAGVTLVRRYDAATAALLAEGKRVVLVPDSKNWADTAGGAYATDYWNWPMFNGTPGTMGLLCQPEHPALAGFPTAFHSERQWSALAHASTPVILTDAPRALRPIVQTIDNYERNDRLGLVFEAKVGAGSLLVCAVDVLALQEKPEARQLLASLLAYAGSTKFAPTVALTPVECARFLRPSLAQKQPVQATSFFQPPWGAKPEPARAIDGDICTKWVAADDDKAPALTIDLGAGRQLDAVQVLWERDEAGYRYTVEVSNDGAAWTLVSDQRTNAFADGRHYVTFAPVPARHLRVTLTGWPTGGRACIRELRALGQ